MAAALISPDMPSTPFTVAKESFVNHPPKTVFTRQKQLRLYQDNRLM
jgi:hypothetical protein